MRFVIMLEQTETGFAVQVPDLAISAFGHDVDAAKRAARAASEAIRVNLDAYREAPQAVPSVTPAFRHLENPEYKDLLFAHVDVAGPNERVAA